MNKFNKITRACELKNYDYCSQIASLPFGNQQRPANNDLSMMPRSINRENSSNTSWVLKKMNDFRSEIENLPGSTNSRIPKTDHYFSKNCSLYQNRNVLSSNEIGNNSINKPISKKFPSENQKTCVKKTIKLIFYYIFQ